jgi:hypothetical protein
MNVEIYHAGNNEMITIIHERKRRILLGQFRKHTFGFSVDANNIRVFLCDKLAFAFAVTHMPS